ncbi:MAG: dihydroorotase [Desulfobacteraceae bacterium]
MRIRFKGAHIVDPGRVNERKDLIVKNGMVETLVDPSLPEEDPETEILDVTGMTLVPGLIDLHVHLREPGAEYKETVETGLRAAVRGGFTAVCPMPNTDPVNDNAQVTQFLINRAGELGLCRVYPVGAITQGLGGINLAEHGEMKTAGIAAISDDGHPVEDARLMRRAMEYAGSLGLLVISHSEDKALSRNGAMNEGAVATRLGIKGIPNAAESAFVMRELALAELTGTPIHIAHVSCKESVEAIKNAKQRGVKVTCETAPHYFTLTDRAVKEYDTAAKMNPPLRTENDRQAIIQGLADNTIDIIATDHAPHSPLEKDVEFDRAAFGIVGLETSLSLSLKLVQDNHISLETLVEKMSTRPAFLLGMDNGLKPGNPADITVFDGNACYTIDPATFFSKGRNSPFSGFDVKGDVVLTMVQGEVVYQKKGD